MRERNINRGNLIQIIIILTISTIGFLQGFFTGLIFLLASSIIIPFLAWFLTWVLKEILFGRESIWEKIKRIF